MKHGLTANEYSRRHQWVRRKYPKAGICTICKETKKTDWSNKTGQYNELNILDWQELCRKCHYKYDREVLSMQTGLNSIESHAKSNAHPSKKRGGFASMTPERRAELGRVGGTRSKR